MNSDINVYLGRDKTGIMRKRALLLRKGCSFEISSSSASEDLGCRRGDFSRKHYGSVELLISSDADGAIQRAGRFRVENGSSNEPMDYTPGIWRRTDVHLENQNTTPDGSSNTSWEKSIRIILVRMQRRTLSTCLWFCLTRTTNGSLSIEPSSGGRQEL